MKQFLMDNWFRIMVVILIIAVSFFYFYMKIKEHNLNVINSMRLCANLDGDSVSDCSNAVKKQYIIKYKK